MKLNNWVKIIIVVLVIFTLVASYSIFFIDFSSYQPEAEVPEFKGPSGPPPTEFKEPPGAPSVKEPTTPPPAN